MNEGTAESLEDEPAKDIVEMKADGPEEFELESTFPVAEKPDTEAHALLALLCMAAKI